MRSAKRFVTTLVNYHTSIVPFFILMGCIFVNSSAASLEMSILRVAFVNPAGKLPMFYANT